MTEITKEQRDELGRLRGIRQAAALRSGKSEARDMEFRAAQRDLDSATRESLPALLDAADEACRFYAADGSYEELSPAEVRRRRIESAKKLADYDLLRAENERLRELLSAAQCPDPSCGGQGFTVHTEAEPACCGHAAPNGDCCGNPVPEPVPVQEECEWCHRTQAALLNEADQTEGDDHDDN